MTRNKQQLAIYFPVSFLLFYFLLASQISLAQPTITFRGRVYDLSTKEALQYVSVSIPTKGFNIITNRHGEFTLHIPTAYRDEKVQLSFIGYKSSYIEVSSIISDSIYSFQLESQVTNLSEISITGQKLMHASAMVQKAINNIPDNYSQRSFRLNAYYRDYTRNVKTEDYGNLIEAAVLIYDGGFSTNNYLNTTFKLEQLRFHPGFSIDSTLNTGYSFNHKVIPGIPYNQVNELTILLGQDPVRNSVEAIESFIPLFGMDFIRDYTFRYNSIIETDSLNIYEIDFSAIPKLKIEQKAKFQIEGKLYIEDKTYALLKLNYKVNCSLPNYEGKFIDVKIEYKKYRNKYYLNYLTVCNYFELNNENEGKYLNFTKDFYPIRNQYFQYRELFVNKIELKPYKHIKNSINIQNDKSLLSDSIHTLAGFWEEYNFPRNAKLLD
jgi:hypothetical protein